MILKAGGVSWQSTRTWKSSNDPEFVAKMSRVLDLYDNPPEDGRGPIRDFAVGSKIRRPDYLPDVA
ncbi:hypothetical protein [Nocardia sp. MW-W600-9]